MPDTINMFGRSYPYYKLFHPFDDMISYNAEMEGT